MTNPFKNKTESHPVCKIFFCQSIQTNLFLQIAWNSRWLNYIYVLINTPARTRLNSWTFVQLLIYRYIGFMQIRFFLFISLLLPVIVSKFCVLCDSVLGQCQIKNIGIETQCPVPDLNEIFFISSYWLLLLVYDIFNIAIKTIAIFLNYLIGFSMLYFC